MNIFEKIYLALLILIIILLTSLFIQNRHITEKTQELHTQLTTFTGWMVTNYEAPYEENNPQE